MIAHQEKIWRFLKDCRGLDKALTAKQLARLTGLNEREVRATIAGLRRRGYRIASAVHPPYGLFIPETPEGARECLGHLYSRIREIGQTAAPLEKAFGRYAPGRQMALELFGGEEEGA